MLEKLQQYMKSHQVLTIIASLVLAWAIYNYSGNKAMFNNDRNQFETGNKKIFNKEK